MCAPEIHLTYPNRPQIRRHSARLVNALGAKSVHDHLSRHHTRSKSFDPVLAPAEMSIYMPWSSKTCHQLHEPRTGAPSPRRPRRTVRSGHSRDQVKSASWVTSRNMSCTTVFKWSQARMRES
jgi:hypothetical protein